MNSKKILAAVMAVMMTAGAAAVLPAGENFNGITTAYAMPVSTDGDFEFTELSNGTLTVSAYNGTDEVVTIPAEHDGKKVTKVDHEIFSGNTTAKKIIVSEGIEMLDGLAFYNVKNLEEIVLPNSLKYLCDPTCPGDGGTFTDCPNLKKINIPDGIKKIPLGTFGDLPKLESIKLPDSVTIIEDLAFANDHELTDVNIPNGVKEIAMGAFSQCTSLENVTLPEGLETLGSAAFASTAVKEITIPKSVTEIGDKAVGFKTRETGEVDDKGNKIVEWYRDDDVKINVYANSYAYKYFEEKGIEFEVLDPENITSEPDSSSSVESKPDSSSSVESKPDSSSTTDSKPDSTPDSKPDSKTDSKTDNSSTTESKPDSKPDSKQDEKIMLGDVNGDKKIDIEDAVQVIGHVNGVKALTADEAKRANVDGNSKVDIEDAVTIIGHVNGIKAIGS